MKLSNEWPRIGCSSGRGVGNASSRQGKKSADCGVVGASRGMKVLPAFYKHKQGSLAEVQVNKPVAFSQHRRVAGDGAPGVE